MINISDKATDFFTSPPFVPLQGESLSFDTESQDEVQDEPLSLNKERGIGGEVL